MALEAVHMGSARSSLPLCARMTRMLVGSPITQAIGFTVRLPSSAISRRTPMQPTSSS